MDQRSRDMKGSAANTHYNSGQRMLVKKLPEAKERNVLKDHGTMPSAHKRQSIVFPPPQPDCTTHNSWAIGKNIQQTLVSVVGIITLRITYLKNDKSKIQRDLFTSHLTVPQNKT